MSPQWTRTHEEFGAEEAMNAVDHGTPWAILWCGGGVSRSSDAHLDRDGLAYVRRSLIDPAERQRLLNKARRKGRTKTVVMAERWERADEGPLILFYESGPYLLPERDTPTRRGH